MMERYAGFLFIILMVMINFNACEGGGAGGSGVSYEAGYVETLSAGSVSFNMIYVPGGIEFFTGQGDNGSATVTSGYWIGETEVTYKLWYEVRDWAVNTASPSYTFANDGSQGDDGTSGVPDDNQEPVTTITRGDALVWCNALTEYLNANSGTSLTCVYRDGSDVPLRDATDNGENSGACYNATQDDSADGFRLPVNDEWELAARYITDSNGDGDIMDSDEYYTGGAASGGEAEIVATTGGTDIDGDGLVEYTDDVAVASFVSVRTSTDEVKSKRSNALGLFDMTGNVSEFCFEMHEFSYARMHRGGDYADDNGYTGGPDSDYIVNGIVETTGYSSLPADYIGLRIVR